MKEILLTKGYKTKVDDNDYNWLYQWNWYTYESNNCKYAWRKEYKNEKTIHFIMHREIIIKRMGLEIPENMLPDHKDRDGLNNQRHNLRVVTIAISNLNRRVKSGSKSGVRGVNLNEETGLWICYIIIKGVRIELGTFKEKENAIQARRRAEIKYLGESFIE